MANFELEDINVEQKAKDDEYDEYVYYPYYAKSVPGGGYQYILESQNNEQHQQPIERDYDDRTSNYPPPPPPSIPLHLLIIFIHSTSSSA